MALSAKLEMRQGQQLVMTPQLQQAIRLLQLSNMELGQFVETELERIPEVRGGDMAHRGLHMHTVRVRHDMKAGHNLPPVCRGGHRLDGRPQLPLQERPHHSRYLRKSRRADGISFVFTRFSSLGRQTRIFAGPIVGQPAKHAEIMVAALEPALLAQLTRALQRSGQSGACFHST